MEKLTLEKAQKILNLKIDYLQETNRAFKILSYLSNYTNECITHCNNEGIWGPELYEIVEAGISPQELLMIRALGGYLEGKTIIIAI